METVADVIARMVEIEGSLPAHDGVARFNDLYLAVTREVEENLVGEAFEDQRFLTRLDVVFAELYFAAVEAAGSGGSVPHAWAPLFEARTRPKVAPIQFALAGMNAHINHDLSLALVATCRELDLDLDTDTPHHRDYLRVNRILERVEGVVKVRLNQGLVGVADEALGRVDDVVAVWSVARARDAAWTQAQTLRALERLPALRDDYVVTLGHIVGFAGRGLLIPTI